MEIFFYKAGCGDAARLRFIDDEGKQRNIFIDSGYERTYRDFLNTEIDEIIIRGELIDLWIISHIHDDHIGGAVNYINAINKGFQADVVDKWIYNPPRSERQLIVQHSISAPASISQGDFLGKYLNTIGKYPERAIIDASKPVLIGNLSIIFLSPGKLQLQNLHDKYRRLEIPLEKNEDVVTSEAKGAKMRDYHIKVDDFDLSKWKEDDNVDNGSSIAVITEYSGFKVLWLGDAHPSVVSKSLKRLGYSGENPINCKFVKVAHHGSTGNNSDELYSLIKCDNFIMSVSGDNKHRLPNKESLVRILKNPNRDFSVKYKFYFTYSDELLHSIFAVDKESVFEKLNFELHYCSGNMIRIECD